MKSMKYVTRNVGVSVTEHTPYTKVGEAAQFFEQVGSLGAISVRVIQYEPCVIMDVYGEDPEDVALFACLMMDRVVHVNTVLPNDSGKVTR